MRKFKFTSPETTCIATRCGHQTYMSGKVIIFGKEVFISLVPNEKGSADWCLDCIADHAIPCPLCGAIMTVFDEVGTYTLPSIDEKIYACGVCCKQLRIPLEGKLALQEGQLTIS